MQDDVGNVSGGEADRLRKMKPAGFDATVKVGAAGMAGSPIAKAESSPSGRGVRQPRVSVASDKRTSDDLYRAWAFKP